jgi:hypothetical protein
MRNRRELLKQAYLSINKVNPRLHYQIFTGISKTPIEELEDNLLQSIHDIHNTAKNFCDNFLDGISKSLNNKTLDK